MLFADALPAAFLLTLLVARTARERLPPRARTASVTIFAAATLFAVFVHSHQGLYNPYTILWSHGVDRNAARVLDWRFPQFLASPDMLGLHERDPDLLAMPPYVPGEELLPTSDHAIFEGWSIPEGEGAWRWSNNFDASVLFKIESSIPDDEDRVLAIEAGTYDLQVITVRFNGAVVGMLRSTQNWQPSTYAFEIPAELLGKARKPLPGARILQVDFEIPGAKLVGDGLEQRRLGLCLRRITLSTAG